MHERVKSLEIKACTEVEAVNKIAALENEKEQLRQKLADTNAELKKKTRNLYEFKSKFQAKLEFHTSRMRELETKTKEAQKTAQIVETKCKSLQSEKQKKEMQFLEYERKYKQAEEELERFKERHYHFQEDLKKIVAEIDNIKQQLQKKVEELHAEMADSQQKIQRELEKVFEKEKEHRLLLQSKDDVIQELQVQLGAVNQSNNVPNTDNEVRILLSSDFQARGENSCFL